MINSRILIPLSILGLAAVLALVAPSNSPGNGRSSLAAQEDRPAVLPQATSQYAYLPLVQADPTEPPPTPQPPGFPFATKSRYVQTTSWNALYSMGCADGTAAPADELLIVILDFGQPWSENSAQGVLLFVTYQFRATAQIEQAVQGYLYGFVFCSQPGANMKVAVGTNNFGTWTRYEHGVAWAQMINSLNTWIAAQPGYSDRVAARGASDLEPGFRGPVSTRAWVDGYNAAWTGSSYLYNFGSCDSCPFAACPHCTPSNGWTLEDIWYVSYGASANWPVPEIYLTSGVNADQWYRMSVYGYETHGYRMHFLGTLTQWAACQTNGPCNGTDNRPEEGWQQLQDKVNSDSRTMQTILYSSDISWLP